MQHGTAADPIRWGPPSGWMRQHFAVTGEHERRLRYNAKKRRYYHKRKARIATERMA